MQSDQRNICVVMAAMNAEATITRAVASALAQAPVREVIVVDDASRDETVAAAWRADDGTGRLRVVSLPENHGPAGARNHALSLSDSKFFCVLDSDDYMLPGRLERLLARGGDDWDLLADDIFILPAELADTVSETEVFASEPGVAMSVDLPTFVRGNISIPGRSRGELGFLKPIIRRDFLDTMGLRYRETLRLGEDYALYLRALRAGARFKVVGACGYVALERADSLSSRHSAGDLHRLADVDTFHLESPEGLTKSGIRALKEHALHVRRKALYSEALETKRQSGLVAGVLRALRVPYALPYMAVQTLRAWRPHAPERRGRFLIGSHRFT